MSTIGLERRAHERDDDGACTVAAELLRLLLILFPNHTRTYTSQPHANETPLLPHTPLLPDIHASPPSTDTLPFPLPFPSVAKG